MRSNDMTHSWACSCEECSEPFKRLKKFVDKQTKRIDPMTGKDKKWLAEEFCGLEKNQRLYQLSGEYGPWLAYYKEDVLVCSIENWNPLLPAHGWLVLKALVEKAQSLVVNDELQWDNWTLVLYELYSIAEEDKDEFDFWPAVNATALATRKDVDDV